MISDLHDIWDDWHTLIFARSDFIAQLHPSICLHICLSLLAICSKWLTYCQILFTACTLSFQFPRIQHFCFVILSVTPNGTGVRWGQGVEIWRNTRLVGISALHDWWCSKYYSAWSVYELSLWHSWLCSGKQVANVCITTVTTCLWIYS